MDPNTQASTQVVSKFKPKSGFSFGVMGLVIAAMIVLGYFLLGGSFAGGVGQTIEAGNPSQAGNRTSICSGSGAQGQYIQFGSVDPDIDC